MFGATQRAQSPGVSGASCYLTSPCQERAIYVKLLWRIISFLLTTGQLEQAGRCFTKGCLLVQVTMDATIDEESKPTLLGKVPAVVLHAAGSQPDP